MLGNVEAFRGENLQPSSHSSRTLQTSFSVPEASSSFEATEVGAVGSGAPSQALRSNRHGSMSGTDSDPFNMMSYTSRIAKGSASSVLPTFKLMSSAPAATADTGELFSLRIDCLIIASAEKRCILTFDSFAHRRQQRGSYDEEDTRR